MNRTQATGLAAALLLLALTPPLIGSSYLTGVLTVCLIYAIWAMSWDFFSGLTGRENFGYTLFVGIGAYASGYLNVNLGVGPWLGALLAIGLTTVAALIVGLATLRLSGPYFALAMLAMATMVQRLMLIFWEVTGGEEGIQGIAPLLADPLAYYYLVYALAIATGLALLAVARTRWGILLRAIRGDDASCQAAGINTAFYKVASLLLSGAVGGLGGVLYAHYQMQVSPQLFSVLMLMSIITMVYVGGIGSIYGAAGGAILLSFLGEMLRGFGPYRLLVYGIVLILVLFFMPNGLVAPLWRRLGSREGRR